MKFEDYNYNQYNKYLLLTGKQKDDNGSDEDDEDDLFKNQLEGTNKNK